MRAILTAAVLVAVAGLVSAADKPKKPDPLDPKAVVGKWHMKKVGAKGKVEAEWYYEFTADGKYVRMEFDKTGKLDTKNALKGTYKVEGNSVSLVDSNKNEGLWPDVTAKDGKLSYPFLGVTMVLTPYVEKAVEPKKKDK